MVKEYQEIINDIKEAEEDCYYSALMRHIKELITELYNNKDIDEDDIIILDYQLKQLLKK